MTCRNGFLPHVELHEMARVGETSSCKIPMKHPSLAESLLREVLFFTRMAWRFSLSSWTGSVKQNRIEHKFLSCANFFDRHHTSRSSKSRTGEKEKQERAEKSLALVDEVSSSCKHVWCGEETLHYCSVD